MEITSVNVKIMEREGSNMKGIADAYIDDEFVIHNIRIYEKLDGTLGLAMPDKIRKAGPTTNGYHKNNVAHPLNATARKKFEDAIFKKYNETLLEQKNQEEE